MCLYALEVADGRLPGPYSDAQALAFDDESFDTVVMNFGALHMARPEAAFAEARRVLREDGRYAFTLWASPEHSPGARIVEEAVKAHADSGVELPAGPDYFAFGNAEACRAVLGRVGFDPASLVFRTVTMEWEVPSATFVFEAERDAGVRTAAVLAAQKPEVLSAIEAQIASALEAHAHDSGFGIPYAAHVIAVRC
jgi:SAM-dependent methyltransferase